MFQWRWFRRSRDVIFYYFREKSPASVTKVPVVAGSRLLFWTLPWVPGMSRGLYRDQLVLASTTPMASEKTLICITQWSSFFDKLHLIYNRKHHSYCMLDGIANHDHFYYHILKLSPKMTLLNLHFGVYKAVKLWQQQKYYKKATAYRNCWGKKAHQFCKIMLSDTANSIKYCT